MGRKPGEPWLVVDRSTTGADTDLMENWVDRTAAEGSEENPVDEYCHLAKVGVDREP